MKRAVVAVAVSVLGAAVLPGLNVTRGYNFDFWGNPVPAPQAYAHVESIDGADLGVGSFRTPGDICIGPDGGIYIADTGNGRVVRIEQDRKSAHVLTGHAAAAGGFRGPTGLYLDHAGALFVADMESGRVLQFDDTGRLIWVYGQPDEDVEGAITGDFIFRPQRIAASPIGKLYVIAEGVYDGLMEYDLRGGFSGFIGAPRVAPSALDVFWSRFATAEQRTRVALFLPTEYSSLDLDERGFIYVVEMNNVKRLNPAGVDIFVPKAFTRPQGDVTVADHAVKRPSLFVDIVVRDSGMFTVLDLERGRIFTYDGVGNLLYAFGGIGLTKDLFQSPVAIVAADDEILVLDRALNRILVYRPLPYAQAIHAAVRFYEQGRYDESADRWREVLKSNVNLDIAYSGIARSNLQKGEYASAMRNFQLGHNRDGFSEAFRYHRKELLADRFTLFVLVMAVLAAGAYAYFRFTPFRRLLALVGLVPFRYRPDTTPGRLLHHASVTAECLLYSSHVIYHPYDGFWDVKYERRGNVPAALVILVAFCLVYVFSEQQTAFLFNYRDVRRINLLAEFVSILAPFLVWCAVNWALSILLEGKGTFREIVMVSAYSFVPALVFFLLATVLSPVLSAEEGTILILLRAVGLVWSLYLLFAGILVIHEYTAARTLASLVLTVVGIGAVLFIGLLFFSVINLMIGFVSTVYGELVLRF